MNNEAVLRDTICGPFFRHTQLDRGEDSIRLVKVLHDLSADGLVQCSINHVKLSPGAADGALILHLGSPRDRGTITVNRKILTVRKNLENFLQVAKTQLAYGFFWMDAICIDQDNAAERDYQVQRIGATFAKGKMFVTWLGCEPDLERMIHLL
ncbi:uncharacterized protein M421DRAFT_75816, partial [Didymella exigua CBS 183.55]